jgi:hypothetical protein
MDNGTSSHAEIRDLARAHTRDLLADSTVFHEMSLTDQRQIYQSLVDQFMNAERQRQGLSRPMATDSGKDMGYKGYDPAFGADTRAFTELVESVDFPKFVADLLKAVFDANLKVMKQQTDAFIKLMKEATKSIADFIKQVKDDESFARLAQTKPDTYGITMEKGAGGEAKIALTNPQGDKVDPEDAEVKKHVMDTKREMAQEHQRTLQQIIAMGVNRMVVDKGLIEASVEFTVKANRESKAHHEDQNINVAQVHAEYESPLGGLFGGPSGSMDVTNTNIQINTSDKKATDDLSASLKGKVQIQFKTDYFELDKFADMYIAGLPPKPGGPAGQNPVLPPGR